MFKRLLTSLSILLMVITVMCSCGHSQPSDAEPPTVGALDSIIRKHLAELYNNPDQTIRSLDSLQQHLTDTASRLQVELFKASAQAYKGDTLGAIRVQQDILDWCRVHPGHLQLEGLVLNHRGVILMQRGSYAEANNCLDRACGILTSEAGAENLINVHINSADAHMHYGQLAKAAERYRRAHFIADSTGMKRLLPAINAGLGLVYVQLENFKLADQYLDEAEANLNYENDYGRFFYYTTRGNSYFFEKRYNEAIPAFEEARKVGERMNKIDFIAQCDGNIGEVLLAMDSVSKARPYIARGEAFARQHPEGSASLRFYLYSLALDVALNDGDHQRANQLLHRDLVDVEVLEPHYRALHYRRLSNFARQQSDWQSAYRYNQIAQEIEDTIKSRQVLQNIVEIRTRYDQDTTLLHQRYIIANYATQTARQSTIIVLIISVVIIGSLVGVIILFRRHRRTEQRNQQQAQQMACLRMSILQNRMQPHYVFNVLGTILPRFSRYPELSNSIGLLIDSLRANLLALDKPTVSLNEELDVVTKYVELHHLTHNGLPRITTNISTDIPADMKIPTMSLQIPVENALKHAFPTPSPADCVEIAVTYSDNIVTLAVTDNGVGYNPRNILQTGRDTGTGLRVLSRTIEILNAHNVAHASINIRNRDDAHGTIIILQFPVGYKWDV